MKKGNTVYEDKAEKEERRRQKRMENLRKHVVNCPHCGEEVLDHMTECPHCKGKLTPGGYKPMDEKLQKRIRWILTGVFVVALIGVAMWYFLSH